MIMRGGVIFVILTTACNHDCQVELCPNKVLSVVERAIILSSFFFQGTDTLSRKNNVAR